MTEAMRARERDEAAIEALPVDTHEHFREGLQVIDKLGKAHGASWKMATSIPFIMRRYDVERKEELMCAS